MEANIYGNFTYPLKLSHFFANSLSIFKTSHLGVSNFGFSYFFLFIQKMSILPLTLKLYHSQNDVIFKGKIGIPLRFSVWNGQSKIKPNINPLK